MLEGRITYENIRVSRAGGDILHYMSDPKHAKHLTEEECIELIASIARLRTKLDRLASP